jgi:hypothetical protein
MKLNVLAIAEAETRVLHLKKTLEAMHRVLVDTNGQDTVVRVLYDSS